MYIRSIQIHAESKLYLIKITFEDQEGDFLNDEDYLVLKNIKYYLNYKKKI